MTSIPSNPNGANADRLSDIGKAADELQAQIDSKLSGTITNETSLEVQNMQQKLNRLISMVSNIEKAKHDTAKAVINNMRV